MMQTGTTDPIISTRGESVAAFDEHAHAVELRDRPLPELARRFADDFGTLVRQEISLARVEVSEKASVLGKSAGFFGAAAILGLGAYLALTAAIVAALALVMPVWAAALIVAVLYVAGAALGALAGQKAIKAATPLVPERTAATVKEDVEWAKAHAASNAK